MINMLWLDVEFNHLSARAGQLLNRGPWLLRLGIRPSFDPWCTIGVLRKQMTDTLVVRRWDSESDAAKFRSPLQRLKHGWRLAPTITDATAATDASLLDRVLSDLATIQPPLKR